jgi:hypothetical protein
MHGKTNNDGPKANLHKNDVNERRGEMQPPETVTREARATEEEYDVEDKMDVNSGTER